MRTFKTLPAAAKAVGAKEGVSGRAGGWLYRNGVPLTQGWRDYGKAMVRAGRIDPQDAEGRSVYHLGPHRTASELAWRNNARRYAIVERGQAQS
jgi:hypothetical protein